MWMEKGSNNLYGLSNWLGFYVTWNGLFIERDGYDMINSLKRYETDGESGTSLRMNFGGNVPAASTDRYFQITFSSLTRVHYTCKSFIIFVEYFQLFQENVIAQNLKICSKSWSNESNNIWELLITMSIMNYKMLRKITKESFKSLKRNFDVPSNNRYEFLVMAN